MPTAKRTIYGARCAVVLLALTLTVSDGAALDAKPDLAVLVFGTGPDTRPITAPGQQVSFVIGLDTRNAVGAHHGKVMVVLPVGLTFRSGEPRPTRVENGNRPVWEIDALDPKVLPIFFQVTADADSTLAPGSQLEISAYAQCSECSANAPHNHADYTIHVQPVGPALVFAGSTLDSVPLTADGPTTFEVNLTNDGNLVATDTRLEVTLPSGVKFNKADPQPELPSGQVVTVNLGDLARAESRSVTMTVAVDAQQLQSLQGEQPLTFAFRLLHKAAGIDVTDSHFEIVKHLESAGYDVAVWLTAEGTKEPGEVSPGDDVTCVVTYANIGNQTAHNVSVTLSLGSGLTIAKADPQPAGTDTSSVYAGGVMHWNIGDLDVGMSHSIRSIVHVTSVPDDGALVDAVVTADGIDIDASNNGASLLWHSPLAPGVITAAARSAGAAHGAAHGISHLWRYVVGLLLLMVAAVFVVRVQRNRAPPRA